MRLRKVKKYTYVLSDEKEFFHSQFELDCWNLIKDNIPESRIERQKKYLDTSKMTVDFYFPDIKLWLEVSSYNINRKAGYKKRLEYKKKVVEQKNEKFQFANSFKDLNVLLEKIKPFYKNLE